MYYGLAFCFLPFFIHTHNITLDHARHSKAPRDEGPRDGQGVGVLRRGVVESNHAHLHLRRLPTRTIKRRRQLVVALLVGAVAVGEVVVGVGGVDADDTFDQLG